MSVVRDKYHLVSVHPYQITTSCQVEPRYYPPIDKEPQPAQFRNNSHNGIISPTTRRKISRALDYLRYIAKHQHTTLALITLTLSHKQIHTDQELKYHCFNHFLKELERKWKVEHYVCKY